VAFFDGSHAGDLSSRLTSDIWFLVAPIQQLLGSVVSNTLLLVGGVILCFVTSWRLSLLAFTTVGPIVYVTQTYAEWSQHINAEIYAAAGRANSIAIEALTNIRTVKACGTEGYEQRRFFDASYEALTKGVKDAWVGSLMTCINSYLDLFSTVLILWYGGTLAMRQDQGMTAGKLIAYQLYFNMLNGAYSSLLDLVTQLTRSAGASSRVFDLMDALPAIDIRKGKPVSKEGIRGDIALKAVDFCYQMRPEKQVLKAVSLQIPAGSVCALVGHSGGGKSTIVSLLQRMYDQIGRAHV
jgi:ATP-binding cassette subfamily B protein